MKSFKGTFEVVEKPNGQVELRLTQQIRVDEGANYATNTVDTVYTLRAGGGFDAAYLLDGLQRGREGAERRARAFLAEHLAKQAPAT